MCPTNFSVLPNQLKIFSNFTCDFLICPMDYLELCCSFPYIWEISKYLIVQFNSVQLFSRVWLFGTPWITARQASLSITNSRSSLKLMSIQSVMPSSYLILCHPLLLLPSIPASIRVFSNESTLRMRWPKYWNFSFSISPSKSGEHNFCFNAKWAG